MRPPIREGSVRLSWAERTGVPLQALPSGHEQTGVIMSSGRECRGHASSGLVKSLFLAPRPPAVQLRDTVSSSSQSDSPRSYMSVAYSSARRQEFDLRPVA
ncbi:hypothetical protein AAFF_G00008170 [Aldrovandia affinis]|uniref:Uncharacterized protein n=1 Tax=Aldrovandia affinis TaxID=143900 RepID=A0AAD7T648_9TELE|nr:hypothetical protein AAFF_G00008170 [Aldrovandia affinis]